MRITIHLRSQNFNYTFVRWIVLVFWCRCVQLCLSAEPDPCSPSVYQLFERTGRLHHKVTNSSVQFDCDSLLDKRWYRISTKDGGTDLAQYCVPIQRCSTQLTMWMNGAVPSISDGIVNREVCLHFIQFGCCFERTTIRVKNCGQYNVYELLPASGCYHAYCLVGSNDTITSDSPWTTSSFTTSNEQTTISTTISTTTLVESEPSTSTTSAIRTTDGTGQTTTVLGIPTTSTIPTTVSPESTTTATLATSVIPALRTTEQTTAIVTSIPTTSSVLTTNEVKQPTSTSFLAISTSPTDTAVRLTEATTTTSTIPTSPTDTAVRLNEVTTAASPTTKDIIKTTTTSVNIITTSTIIKTTYNRPPTSTGHSVGAKSSTSSSMQTTTQKPDRTPPKILSCPSDKHVYTKSSEAVAVQWLEPTAADDTSPQDKMIAKSEPKSGTFFKPGESVLVNYKVMDESGNANLSCKFKVFVERKEIECAGFPPTPMYGTIHCEGSSPLKCTPSCKSPTYKVDPAFKHITKFTCDAGTWNPTFQVEEFQLRYCYKPVPPFSYQQKLTIKVSVPCDDTPEFRNNVTATLKSDLIDEGVWMHSQTNINVSTQLNMNCGEQEGSINLDMKTDVIFSSSATSEDDIQVRGSVQRLEAFLKGHTIVLSDTHYSLEVKAEKLQIKCRENNRMITENICAPCPPGTSYSKNLNECKLCPVNTYQNREAQASCDPCPEGKVSKRGSFNKLACISTQTPIETPSTTEPQSHIVVIAASVGGSLLFITLFGVVVFIIVRHRRKVYEKPPKHPQIELGHIYEDLDNFRTRGREVGQGDNHNYAFLCRDRPRVGQGDNHNYASLCNDRPSISEDRVYSTLNNGYETTRRFDESRTNSSELEGKNGYTYLVRGLQARSDDYDNKSEASVKRNSRHHNSTHENDYVFMA